MTHVGCTCRRRPVATAGAKEQVRTGLVLLRRAAAGRQGFRNKTTGGLASTAGKFASDFATSGDPGDSTRFAEESVRRRRRYVPGWPSQVCQTASVVSPYIYGDNWVDDMELAALEMFRRTGDGEYHYGRPLMPRAGDLG